MRFYRKLRKSGYSKSVSIPMRYDIARAFGLSVGDDVSLEVCEHENGVMLRFNENTTQSADGSEAPTEQQQDAA